MIDCLIFFSGFVYYKGALVNIDNLNEEISKNETARLKTEEKLMELKEELSKFKPVVRGSRASQKLLFYIYN